MLGVRGGFEMICSSGFIMTIIAQTSSFHAPTAKHVESRWGNVPNQEIDQGLIRRDEP
jgi:hypothetical protein